MVNFSTRTTPMMRKLSELLVSGHREAATRPTSPSDRTVRSPRGLKNYDLGGVGLAIVAALEKSGDHNSCGRDVLAKHGSARSTPIRSNPIPVNSIPNKSCDHQGFDDDDEDYTLVRRRGPNDKSFTRFCYDDKGTTRQRSDFGESNHMGMFKITTAGSGEEFGVNPTSDFLSSCNLCKKKLHGKDIYMYRGEKAFCSSECRSSQILMDERKERCRSEALLSVSSSSYSRGQVFSTGIFAI